jgi:hypothetical protein
MRALRRKKAKDGEVPTSVKALSPEDLKALRDLCERKGNLGARQWVCTPQLDVGYGVELMIDLSLHVVHLLDFIPLSSTCG